MCITRQRLKRMLLFMLYNSRLLSNTLGLLYMLCLDEE
jgi:hypothetical protein